MVVKFVGVDDVKLRRQAPDNGLVEGGFQDDVKELVLNCRSKFMEAAILQDEAGLELLPFHDAGIWLSLLLWHGLAKELSPALYSEVNWKLNCTNFLKLSCPTKLNGLLPHCFYLCAVLH